MIHYQLRCSESHEFDGWFKDSEGFDTQAERGLISCPVCAGTKINRALMAPMLARKNLMIEAGPAAPPAVAAVPKTGAAMPDAVRAMLHKLRGEVEKNCTYVGGNFAEEARKIHNGEAEPRGIYGETTEAQAEALADDGIEVASIPWLPKPA
jgi:hypothetical protein